MTETRLLYRVPYADVDQMGVVYYAHYLVWLERGRTEHLRQRGMPYATLEQQGILLPVIECHCDYLKPARYDDEVTIVTSLPEMKGVRIKMACTILRGADTLARGYTWHVCTTREGKPCRMPDALAALVEKGT